MMIMMVAVTTTVVTMMMMMVNLFGEVEMTAPPMTDCLPPP